ncbi:glycosyltransferase family 2 protein, partial [Cohnella sp. JJ-181]|uniref:glycosyltransferase family 2 protein n=1 Tax=Cohnella rhizoplanae TaxID=2974897 RepID=UPI00232E021B
TPSYNSEKYIQNTIQSVINQSYENWEMIIVDDCSTDETIKIIKEYQQIDKRIVLITKSVNEGAAVSRNTAINVARGKYLAFLDSDDIWYPNKLDEQITFMKNSKVTFSYSMYRVMNENGEDLNRVIKVPNKIDYNYLLKNTIIGCLTVILDRELIGEVKMPNIRAKQDTALWLGILKKGQYAYGYQKELASYRLVKGSISSNKFKAIMHMWNLYRRIERIGVVKSAWYLMNYGVNAIKKRS